MDEFDATTDNLKVSAKPNAMILFNPAMARAPDERLSDKYLKRVNQGVRRTNPTLAVRFEKRLIFCTSPRRSWNP
jgi:hypothetical protein